MIGAQAHLRGHNRKRPYCCHICGLVFTSSSHRARHQRTCLDGSIEVPAPPFDLDAPPMLSPQRLTDEPEVQEMSLISQDWDELSTEPSSSSASALAAPHLERRVEARIVGSGAHPKMVVKTNAVGAVVDKSQQDSGQSVDEYQEVVLADALPPAIGRRRAENECMVSGSAFS